MAGRCRISLDVPVNEAASAPPIACACHAGAVGTNKPHSAKDAVRVAEQYVADTIGIMDVGRSDPGTARVIDELRGLITGSEPDGFRRARVLLTQLEAVSDREYADFINVSVQTAEAAKLWRRHRVVYRVHQGLADSLVDTETRTAVPCEVFARLPHPDPFVVFPTPIRAPTAQDSRFRLVEQPVFVGMLVTAMTEHEQLCSTVDPQAHQLCIALASKIQYEGHMPGHDETILLLPLSGEYSIDDLIARAAEYGSYGHISIAEQRQVYNLAISLLLYLCSSHRDTREYRRETTGRRGRKAGHNGGNSTIIDTGFDVGPTLQATHRSFQHHGGATSTGNGVRAHLRRAHWHTYWTGPRTSPTPEIRWLHPILVNRHHSQGRATVVDVADTQGH